MQLGMIGLGRMGVNMVLRLLRAGHDVHVYDKRPDPVQTLARQGAKGSTDLAAFVQGLAAPRAVSLMVPAAAVDDALMSLVPLLAPGDTVIDGGNSYYQDDLRHAEDLRAKGLHYIDVGVWGLERGYCHMIGGDAGAVGRLDPIFSALAPGIEAAPRTQGARVHRRKPSTDICSAVRTGPDTSSRWCTTASSMA